MRSLKSQRQEYQKEKNQRVKKKKINLLMMNKRKLKTL